jgi:hypothetical protein
VRRDDEEPERHEQPKNLGTRQRHRASMGSRTEWSRVRKG